MRSRQAAVADLHRVNLQPLQHNHDPRPYLNEDFSDEQLGTICARALEHEGRIIACYGLTPSVPGVADAWALLSLESLEY